MASTYSKLKIELIGTGDQAGQWGTTTNNNLGSSSAGVYRGLEQAIVGMATISSGFVANSYTLPYTNSNDDQEFRCLVLNITASLSNPSDLIVPAIQKPYIVINSSGQTVTVKVSGQTGVAVPNGAKILLYNTGTDVGTAITYLTELKLGGNLTMPSAGSINDSNGNELIKFPSAVASAVNELTISNAATGSAPTLSATGGDTNIGITLTPKGTGTFLVTGNTTLGDATTDTITLTGTVQPGVVISGSSSGDALRITQTGTGNALLVEDSANPDSSPFVVNASGNVGIGTDSPGYKLNVSGAGYVFGLNGGGTTRVAQTFGNTGGGLDLGIEGSAGGTVFTGGSAYAGVIGTNNATVLQLGTNGTIRATLDSSGNLGLGVTPSTWFSSAKVFQIGNGLSLWSSGNTNALLSQNLYLDATATYRWITANPATNFSQSNGAFTWQLAAGTPSANGAIGSFTTHMTLDASGDLAIGTTTAPGARVRIKASNTTGSALYNYLNCTNEVDSDFQIRVTGSASTDKRAAIGTTTNTPLAFITSDTERARITSGGNLLVGATAASYGMRMRVDGGIASTGSVQFNIDGTAATDFEWVLRLGSGMRFYVNNASVLATLTSSGVWTNASDARYKENIRPVTYGLAEVMQLQPRAYNIIGSEKQEIGFVAQEVEPFIPELVESSRNSVTEEERLTLSYGQMSAVLVKAIQEQQALITSLTARVAALEGTQP